MADREVQEEGTRIPEVLESVLVWCMEDAKKQLEEGKGIAPFTALAVGDTLFTEEHEAETVEDCMDSARRTVAHAVGASAYGFCYDGYVELDEGTVDAIVAEGGLPGEVDAYAFAYIYKLDEEGKPHFEDEYIFIGTAPNFMMGITGSEEEGFTDGQEVEYSLQDYLKE